MTKSRVTELEGAILGVLRRSPGMTAYAVRQAFLGSASEEWSGSAGAVYPAIERMRKGGLLRARALADARGGKAYALSPAGVSALDDWLCDVARASGPGTDPFRTRAGLWPMLPARKRRALMHALAAEIADRRRRLSKTVQPDQGDRIMQELHIELLALRLRWLAAQ
jgi:DNA-binding PadR family transcriptional regulator